MKKIRVGIICGGQSAEHEISLLSARNVLAAIDKEKFEPVILAIDKAGTWHQIGEDHFLLNAENAETIQLAGGGQELQLTPTTAPQMVDVVFPVLHGPMGEDGTVQGLLKLAGIPFVGCDVLGAAVGMDKDVMKRLLDQAGIPVARFETLRLGERDSFDADALITKLGLPIFVKPVNMGSSVGVTKVRTKEELLQAIDEAFQYDTKVIFEEAIVGREVECAVLGNDHPEASVVGEVVLEADYYSYDVKYLGVGGVVTQIPADLPEAVSEEVRRVAVQTFKVLESAGLARVDCFVRTSDNKVLVNEINTLPGFTNISMYPKLWEASGIGYTDLITRLIELAIERHEQRKKLQISRLPEEK